jgi:hypothetical protein
MQKYAFFVHQIITPFIYHVSLSQNFSYAKKNSMGYAKKREKKKYPYQKACEKKMHAKDHEEKKRKRKIQGVPKKRESHDSRSTKNI